MKRLIIALLFTLEIMYCQQPTPVTPNAKCIIPITITATGTSIPSTTGYDNRQTGCDTWVLQYSSTGFTVVSLLVESAPAGSNTPPGTPGTYVAFAGTVSTGINPNTATTQGETFFSGYYPWMRVTATLTGSGRLIGVLIGTSPSTNVNVSVSSTSCAGTIGTPCIVAGPDAPGAASTASPVQIAGLSDTSSNVKAIQTDNAGYLGVAGNTVATADGVTNLVSVPALSSANGFNLTLPYLFNGSTWDRQFKCNSQASFNLSSSGDTQIIAASGSTTIRICHLSFSTTATEDIKITRGTGSNCGTGTADVTGLYKSVQSAVFNWGPEYPLKGAASGAICLNQSAGQALGGIVIYAQY